MKNLMTLKVVKSMIYVRGLKYSSSLGFNQSQKEILGFIEKCKASRKVLDGYISEQFYDLQVNSNYKFFFRSLHKFNF